MNTKQIRSEINNLFLQYEEELNRGELAERDLKNLETILSENNNLFTSRGMNNSIPIISED